MRYIQPGDLVRVKSAGWYGYVKRLELRDNVSGAVVSGLGSYRWYPMNEIQRITAFKGDS